jgi:hypothetical protein
MALPMINSIVPRHTCVPKAVSFDSSFSMELPRIHSLHLARRRIETEIDKREVRTEEAASA